MKITQLKAGSEITLFELFQAIANTGFEKWTNESKQRWFNIDYSLDYWRKLLKEGELPCFACFYNEKMVGFVSIEDINFGVAYLGWVGVLKEYRGLGIASKLMVEVEKWCVRNNIHKIELETQEPELKLFYEKLGYNFEEPSKWHFHPHKMSINTSFALST